MVTPVALVVASVVVVVVMARDMSTGTGRRRRSRGRQRDHRQGGQRAECELDGPHGSAGPRHVCSSTSGVIVMGDLR